MEPSEHNVQLNTLLTLTYLDHNNPLTSRPRSTFTLSQQPPDKSTPLDGEPPSYDSSDKLKPVDESCTSPTKVETACPTSVEKPSNWWSLSAPLRFLFRPSNQYSSLNPGEEEFTIDQEIYSVIIPMERENLPVFNLAAKLGDKRGSRTTIGFRCTTMPRARFKEIHLFVRFFDSGPSNLIGIVINKKDERKPKIVKYTRSLVLDSVEVEHSHGQEVAVNLGANAAGATGSAGVTRNHDIHYKKVEGAEVYGLLKSKDMSEVCWTWTAPCLPNAVLKGDCDFEVELENVRESVKAGFRVVCKMDRGITNILQANMEAPKKQKPRLEHVVTRLKLNRQD